MFCYVLPIEKNRKPVFAFVLPCFAINPFVNAWPAPQVYRMTTPNTTCAGRTATPTSLGCFTEWFIWPLTQHYSPFKRTSTQNIAKHIRKFEFRVENLNFRRFSLILTPGRRISLFLTSNSDSMWKILPRTGWKALKTQIQVQNIAKHKQNYVFWFF